MALSIEAADDYINLFVIDVEDWVDCDDERKTRILNVAEATLATYFKHYGIMGKQLVDLSVSGAVPITIPEHAVYVFCATLAVVYNDQNKLALQGVQQISASGVASLMFKLPHIKFPGSYKISDFIPQEAFDLIGDANGGIKLGGKRVKWMVL